jgi:hypothetical protein
MSNKAKTIIEEEMSRLRESCKDNFTTFYLEQDPQMLTNIKHTTYWGSVSLVRMIEELEIPI